MVKRAQNKKSQKNMPKRSKTKSATAARAKRASSKALLVTTPYKCQITSEQGICLMFFRSPRTGKYDQPRGGIPVNCSGCRSFFASRTKPKTTATPMTTRAKKLAATKAQPSLKARVVATPYKCSTLGGGGTCLMFYRNPKTGDYDRPPAGIPVACTSCKFFF
jgi:hypothetical protein